MISRICGLLVAVACSGCLTLSYEHTDGGENIETTLVGDVTSVPAPTNDCELVGVFAYDSGPVSVRGFFDCDEGNPQSSAFIDITGLEQEDFVFGGCSGIEKTLFGFRGFNCSLQDSLLDDRWTGSLEYVDLPF